MAALGGDALCNAIQRIERTLEAEPRRERRVDRVL